MKTKLLAAVLCCAASLAHGDETPQWCNSRHICYPLNDRLRAVNPESPYLRQLLCDLGHCPPVRGPDGQPLFPAGSDK